MSCLHPHPIPHSVTYTITTDQGLMWAVHVTVHCPDCGIRFRFLGDMPLAPQNYMEALMDRRGAWVSASGDEMACVLAPDVLPGEGLLSMDVQGSA